MIPQSWPEEAISKAFDLLKDLNYDNLTIVDVGAHKGESLFAFHKNLTSSFNYVGLEPNPISFKEFKKVGDSIYRSESKIHCLNLAIGSSDGVVDFFETKASEVAGILSPTKGLNDRVPSGDHEVVNRIKVEIRTLSTISEDYELSKMDLLKIDTEGFDLEVLKGARSLLKDNPPRVIITEVFFVPYRTNQAYFWDIANFLADEGYHFVNIYDARDTTQGRLYTANGLWVSSEIAALNHFL